MQSVPPNGDSLRTLTSALQGAMRYFTSMQAPGRVERVDLHSPPTAHFRL
jgi:hypothetical protein